jgi:SNF2 family DNA or RNA helicase
MHAYQETMAAWMTYRTGGKPWAGLGLGKTVATLTAIKDAREIFPTLKRAVVFGTRRIVEETWPDEIAAWDHIDFSYVVCTRALARREAAIAKFNEGDTDLLLVSYDHLVMALDLIDMEVFPDIAVLDELSLMKGHSSGRAEKFEDYKHLFKRTWGLTATPAPKGYPGLWAQENATFPRHLHNRLGHNITAYRERYFEKTVVDASYAKYKIDESSKLAVQRTIRSTTLRMDTKDYLPPGTPSLYRDVEVHWPTKKMAKLYRDMQRKFLVELEESKNEHKIIEAVHSGAKQAKLRQMTAGFIYETVDEQRHAIDLHTAKIDRIEEAIGALNYAPLIVFVNFKYEFEMLRKRFKQMHTLDSPNAVKRFQNGEIELLAMHPASGGHGLNLQYACNHAIWMSLPHGRLELYQQANGRIDRQGQEKQARFYHLLMENSIDYLALAMLNAEANEQDELLDAMNNWRSAA